jgi:hypothetical protein
MLNLVHMQGYHVHTDREALLQSKGIYCGVSWHSIVKTGSSHHIPVSFLCLSMSVASMRVDGSKLLSQQ